MSGDPPLHKKNGKFCGKRYFASVENLGTKKDIIPTQDEPSEIHVPTETNEKECFQSNCNWREGRRVVELDVLADQLKGCKNCNAPLFLQNCTGERRYGLGSILYIPCSICPYVNPVSTGKRHRLDESKRAYLDAGMGPNQTTNFSAALNIPPMSVKNLKEREREIGNTIEKCVDLSCRKALDEEIALSKNQDVICGNGNEDEIANITVFFDGAWQKRGSGRSYSSSTGHATMIGEKSGKCVQKGVKSANCRKCLYVNEKGDVTHDCRKNHSGSAKAMESALAVEMVKDLESEGCRVSCLIMDDDTTTLSRLRQEIHFDITKISDKNHQRKKTLLVTFINCMKNMGVLCPQISSIT